MISVLTIDNDNLYQKETDNDLCYQLLRKNA